MQQIVQLITRYNKPIFIVLFVCCLLPFVTPAIALFAGLAFALTAGQPYPKFSKKTSKYLLQFSVVGLGFGMNLYASLQSGKEGMLFTIVSVFAVLALGMWLGKRLLIDRKTSYLIAAGTAICGGSAIAAVGPVVKADDNQMSMSLGTIFILNAIALFIFPPIGRLVGCHCHSRYQFRGRSGCRLRRNRFGDRHDGEVDACLVDYPDHHPDHVPVQAERGQDHHSLVYSLFHLGDGGQYLSEPAGSVDPFCGVGGQTGIDLDPVPDRSGVVTTGHPSGRYSSDGAGRSALDLHRCH